MKPPVRFAVANLLFPRSLNEAWALYRLETVSYHGLTAAQKITLLAALAGLTASLKSDLTLHRVTRAWSADEYRQRALAGADPRHGDPDAWRKHLDGHHARLSEQPVTRPEVWLAVRLGVAEQTPRPWRAELRRLAIDLGLQDPVAISERQLRQLHATEATVFARLGEVMPAERATTLDLQWLIRRAFARGIGEPALDVHHQPQALAELDGDELAYRPLQADLLRLCDHPITEHDRRLEITTETGPSHQAHLAIGALPSSVTFPGASAELLFTPLEACGFAADATACIRYIPNRRAAALVRRKVIDADNIFGEESHGDHGASPDAARRPSIARALEDYLASDARPPLLHTTLTLHVGAPDPQELERRVEALRAAYGTVALHRPLGGQLALFRQGLPAQATQLPDYADYLLAEQLGAMVPTATTAVGSDSGPLIGHTRTPAPQPVLHDLTEAPRTSRPPATLLAGTLGSGKTVALQLLLYQALLRGSRIVDIDPKGDHRLHELPAARGKVETIELEASDRYRGLLDPLRIAPPGQAEDLTVSFLCDILPAPVPPGWQSAIRRAVRDVCRQPGPRHCHAVLATLRHTGGAGGEAAEALEVYTDAGLAQLGFAASGDEPAVAGAQPVTSLRIRSLPRPLPGTPRAELTEQERIGTAVLRLLAAYAMHLMGSDRSRHKVLGFDEAWFLLQDAAGRRLIEHLNRWGRSENATPILVTHLISDASELDNLIGTRLIFGMESEPEARAALELLRLDPDDAPMRQRLLSQRAGACLMRDLHGRLAPVQIDAADAGLLHLLDTTPPAASLSAAGNTTPRGVE